MKHFFYLFDFLDEKDFAVGYWDSDNRNYYEWNSTTERASLLGSVANNGHVVGLPYNSMYESIPGNAFILPNQQRPGEYTIYRTDGGSDSLRYRVIGCINRYNGCWQIWKYWEQYYGFSFVATSKVPDPEATAAFLYFYFDSLPTPKEVYLDGKKIPVSYTVSSQISGELYQYPLDLRLVRTHATDSFYNVTIPDYPNDKKHYFYSSYKKEAKHVLGFLDTNTNTFYDRSYFGKETILGSIDRGKDIYQYSLNANSQNWIGYLNDENYVVRVHHNTGAHECVGFIAITEYGGYDVMALIPEQAGYTWVGFSPDPMAGAAFLLLQPKSMMDFAATGEYWWNSDHWSHGHWPKSGLSRGQHLYI